MLKQKLSALMYFIWNVDYKLVSYTIVVGLIAAFGGLIASTGNNLLVGGLLGIVVGTTLLLAPRVTVWMLLPLGLFSGFVVSFGQAFSKLPWILTMLSMLLLLPVMLKFIVDNRKIPVFIWIAMVFMLYAIVTTLTVEYQDIAQFIAGFKRYFQMFGLMFALALLAFKPRDYKLWLSLLLLVALAQLPFAMYERFVLAVGRSAGSGGVGAEATDVVAGTFGANLDGGSANAEMAAFVIMAMAFLIARWKEGLLDKTQTIWMCLICFLPLGLGETKLVVVLLPIVWLILMRDEVKKKPTQFVFQFAGLLAVTAMLGAIYIGLNTAATGGRIGVNDVLSETVAYNIGDHGYGTSVLNRTTVVSFWWLVNSKDTIGMLFGHGLGSSYLGSNNPVPGHIALQYIGYGIDLTAISSLLWDVGLIGLLLFLSIYITAWFSAGRLRKRSSNNQVRADALAIQACLFILLVFTLYDNQLVNFLPYELVASAVLGYLGFLVRDESLSKELVSNSSAASLL